MEHGWQCNEFNGAKETTLYFGKLFLQLASLWCPYSTIIISCTLVLFLLVSKRDKSRQNMLQWKLWKSIRENTNDGDDPFSGNCEL